jgi:hypothetical protein
MRKQDIENYLISIEDNLVRDFLCRITELNPTQETFIENDLIHYNLIKLE